MRKLNQLERLGIAHKVTDILINNGCGGHQEDWWDVRDNVAERCLACKDVSMEVFTEFVIGGWCTKDRYHLSDLASQWARQEVYTWDLQQCIDYIGGKVDFIERSDEDVRLMSYRSKAWLKFREQVSDLWHEEPQAYAHIWEPMTPHNVVYNEVIEILTECTQVHS